MAVTSSHLLVPALFALTLCTVTTNGKSTTVDQPLQGNAKKCLTRFWKHPDQFSNCTSQVCFLFVKEEPFVRLDPSMNSEEDQLLFHCNAPSSKFPFLSGIVFAIHNATSVKEALCVWAGNGCTFNDLTAFLSEQSIRNSSLQFAANGILLESSSRVTSTLYPSSSILDSQLVIIGPLDESDGSLSPLRLLLRPFRREAWVLFSVMIAVFITFGLLMVFVFTTEPIRWHTLLFHFMGEAMDNSALVKVGDQYLLSYSGNSPRASSRYRRDSSRRSGVSEMRLIAENADLHESMRRRSAYRVALWLFRAAVSTFLLVFILFYEIAVVNFMFIQNTRPVAKNIARLSEKELSKYSVLKDSTLEGVWRKTVDPYGIYNSSNYPWYRCPTPDDCFDKVLDKSHRARLVVTFESFGNYQLLKRGACNKLTIYKTERRLYSFGAGWLYGKGVKLSTRRRIDKDILDLRVTDNMRQLVTNQMGKNGQTACKARPSSISAAIIGIASLVLVGPSLTLVAIILCVASRNNMTTESVEAGVRTSSLQCRTRRSDHIRSS